MVLLLMLKTLRIGSGVYPEDMVNKGTKRALEIPSLSRPKTSERGVPGNGRIGVPVVFNYNLTRRRS